MRPLIHPRLLRFALCGCAILLAGIATLVRADAPKGAQLAITLAQWGDVPDGKNLDVTTKVAGMVKDGALCITPSVELLGNPGSPAKRLKVGYTLDGVYHSKTVELGDTLNISTHLIIRKAVYGDLPSGDSVDVTDAVADSMRGNHLAVMAENASFGDPAQGHPKQLKVDYTFDGVEKSKTVHEGEKLVISDKGE